ncbi:MAG: hypothetical protein K9K78_07555 [Spirochaetales bacterium]|nr:hypothetical protein [Spirochaetales bacterium]
MISEAAPIVSSNDDIDRKSETLKQLLPENEKKIYDIKELVEDVCDLSSFIEVQKEHAENIVIGLGRLGGRTVGFCANQPKHQAGFLILMQVIKWHGL